MGIARVGELVEQRSSFNSVSIVTMSEQKVPVSVVARIHGLSTKHLKEVTISRVRVLTLYNQFVGGLDHAANESIDRRPGTSTTYNKSRRVQQVLEVGGHLGCE